jgi:hypothetical protein
VRAAVFDEPSEILAHSCLELENCGAKVAGPVTIGNQLTRVRAASCQALCCAVPCADARAGQGSDGS